MAPEVFFVFLRRFVLHFSVGKKELKIKSGPGS